MKRIGCAGSLSKGIESVPGAGSRSAAAAALWVLVFLAPLLPAAPSGADFFRYVGPDGKWVFVDDIGKVPPELRGEAKRYDESLPEPDRRTPLPGPAVLAPALRQPGEIAEETTPILIHGNRAFVRATVGYGVLETEAVLVLDTGASMTTLYRDAVDRLFLRGLNRAVGKTADGGAVSVELATLDFIQVGPHRKSGHRIGIVDPEGAAPAYDGLLGMDFLAGLEFDIDFEREVLVWR